MALGIALANITMANNRLQATANSVRSSPRLKRSVDMTSDVKGKEQLFQVFMAFFPAVHRKRRSQ